MNLTIQKKGSLPNPGLHFICSGSLLIPRREWHLDRLRLQVELDSLPCVVIENKGRFIIQTPGTDLEEWKIIANNASLSGSIRALDSGYFKFLLPAFLQSGILCADFQIKADSETQNLSGDLSFDLDQVELFAGGVSQIGRSKVNGHMQFYSKGLQQIHEMLIPEFTVEISEGNDRIAEGNFQGSHHFENMKSEFSGLLSWEMLRFCTWFKDPLFRQIHEKLKNLQPEPMDIEMQFSSVVNWRDSRLDFWGKSLWKNCLWMTVSPTEVFPLQVQTEGGLQFGKDRQEIRQNLHVFSGELLDLSTEYV